MHQPAANDLPAEMLTDGLMAKTHAEQRAVRIGTRRDEFEADACRVRGARPGRNQERLGPARHRLPSRNRIVADNLDLGAQLHQIMDQVPGEAVIIVDNEDHRSGV